MRPSPRWLPDLPASAVVVVLVALVLAACGGGTDGGGADEEAGPTQDASPAPTMSFELFSGDVTSIEAYQGSPTVVNFWASWCPPCVEEMPDLEAVNQQFPEVQFLGIDTQDQLDDARRLAEETGVTYDLAMDPDGEMFRAFGVIAMPTTFFLSADGRVLDDHAGSITKDDLVERIEELYDP